MKKNLELLLQHFIEVKFNIKIDADVGVLVYDLTNLDSLDGVDYFKEELSKSAKNDICN